MLSWEKWEGSADEWNAALQKFPDYTIYQCHQWGQHRCDFGWFPHKLVARHDGNIVSMAQALVKKLPLNTALAWIPGGPLGPAELLDDQFRTLLRSSTGVFNLYCRINPMHAKQDSDIKKLHQAGWRPVSAPLNSGISMTYNLAADEATRLSFASKNWRHNLKRSQKHDNCTTEWILPEPDKMLAVYQAMQSHKNIQEQISKAGLVSMLESFGSNCLVVRCSDSAGNILALRGALILGNKAWDIFAAATPEGRKVYASHAAFWELMRLCASRGVSWYDMSGVDPVNNKGVYDFKKGTGAEELYHLGEWDWANRPLLGLAANFMIKRRSRGM